MFDFEELPLSKGMNLIWYWQTRNIESEKDYAKIKNKLWQPPVGTEGKGPWSAEAETEALKALQNQLKRG